MLKKLTSAIIPKQSENTIIPIENENNIALNFWPTLIIPFMYRNAPPTNTESVTRSAKLAILKPIPGNTSSNNSQMQPIINPSDIAYGIDKYFAFNGDNTIIRFKINAITPAIM